MELRNSLEGSLQVQLPGTLVFDYPSQSAIATFIAGKLAMQQISVAGGHPTTRASDQQAGQGRSLSLEAASLPRPVPSFEQPSRWVNVCVFLEGEGLFARVNARAYVCVYAAQDHG